MTPSPTNENLGERLEGGTFSTVVRIGDAVHRPAGPWTPTIHALLKHLEHKGYSGAPRVIGIDEQDREILSFMPGRVANWPWPQILISDDGVRQYAQLLRSYHVAVEDFPVPPKPIWQNPLKGTPAAGEIIRHGDTGPWNSVWDNERIVGFIDWDLACPGTAREDVLETLWHVAPLYSETLCREVGFSDTPDRTNRVDLFLQHYGKDLGFTDIQDVLESLYALISQDRINSKKLADQGREPWKTFEKNRTNLDLKFTWIEEALGKRRP